MKYFSTRGGSQTLSFEQTVLAGLAPDGGLYIPTHIPSLPQEWQTRWKTHSFAELSFAILSLYISPSEIPHTDLRSLIEKSYSTFRHPTVSPLKHLKTKDGKREYVLELWHGPTFAFKDVALQFLGNLFEYFLKRKNERKKPGEELGRLTVVGATSGDTGSAAIYGLRNKANISIFILHPKGRVSPIQEAQMTTVTDANVHNVAVAGTFDDCQDIVKILFADKPFNTKHHLAAVNSINWARILAQTVYYFSAYFQLLTVLSSESSSDEPVIQFVVPTGNFGDVLAGFYAMKMGLPVKAKLVVATNANDILARFWENGVYEKVDSSGVPAEGETAPGEGASDGKQATHEGASAVKETLSPAMDILVSSNFERLLWYLAYDNISDNEGADVARREEACRTVNGWMREMKKDGRTRVPVGVLESARKDFMARRVSDEETLETIRNYFTSEDRYIVDPHTAVGLCAAEKIASLNSSNTHQIILSTAHPAKFSEAVTRALSSFARPTSSLLANSYEPGFDFERDVLPEEFRGILEKERRVIDVDRADVELVKEVIEKFVAEREKANSGALSGGV